jgi:hypothetical protein
MSQQLGIILMIDNAAAMAAGSLEGNIYLIDNAKWAGSTGEGTGRLVTAVEGAGACGQTDAQVLNWIPFGIASPPATLPQTFFLTESDLEDLSQQAPQPGAAHSRAFAWASPAAAPPSRPRRFAGKSLDILGRDVGRDVSPEIQSRGAAAAGKKIHYPNPVIANIAGEAVDLRVIYPAQYGSPDLFSDGLYWSATVDTNKIGIFSYTIFVTLFSLENVDDNILRQSVTLPYVSYINVAPAIKAI